MSMTDVASGELSNLPVSGLSLALNAGTISRKMLMVFGICLAVGAGGGAGFAGISAILFKNPGINELRKLDLESSQNQLRALTAEEAGLQARLTALAEVKAGLQAQLTALTADKAGLQAQLTALTADKASLQAQLTALTAEEASLQPQLTALTADKAGLQAQVKTLTDEKADLQKQVASLTEQRDLAKGQVDAVYRDMAQIYAGMGQENKNLKSQLMEIMNKMDRHCVLGLCLGL